MIKAYPIILTPDTGGYVVYVPDLEINTQGNDLAEALYMARGASASRTRGELFPIRRQQSHAMRQVSLFLGSMLILTNIAGRAI